MEEMGEGEKERGEFISALPEGRSYGTELSPSSLHLPTSNISLSSQLPAQLSFLPPVPYLSWGECFLRWLPSSFLKFLHLVAFYDT